MIKIGIHALQLLTILAALCLILLYGSGCSLFRSPEMSLDDHITFGDQHYQDGEFSQALDYYLMAAELDPDNPVSYYKIGLVYGTLHSLEGNDQSVIGGKVNRLSRKLYREDSNYNNAIYYFGKASDMGHLPSRHILRAMYDNIQHLDVQY